MNLPALFSVGFVMGLTGAMAPGPLLTVTISESAKRGGIAGPLLVLGHAVLELALVFLIVFGLGSLLHSNVIFAVISFVGGAVLVYMAVETIRSLKGYTITADAKAGSRSLHPVLSGIVVSVSNPYWLIWWLTVGMGYVMFARTLGIAGILIFFAGHILSDLVWYSFVSYGVHLGGRFLNVRVLKAILFCCSLFLILFGLYFIVNGFRFI